MTRRDMLLAGACFIFAVYGFTVGEPGAATLSVIGGLICLALPHAKPWHMLAMLLLLIGAAFIAAWWMGVLYVAAIAVTIARRRVRLSRRPQRVGPEQEQL